jgi:PTS system galactitol-specific IIB component
MGKIKKILVACGTAIATSTVVAKSLEEELKKRGIEAEIIQCQASEVPSMCEGIDLVVTTTPVDIDQCTPVIQTLAFLTNIGKREVMDQIVAKLTED